MTASDQSKRGVKKTAEILRGSRHTIVLTGAGISTPSGIPDFRSPNSGLWQKYDPFKVASLNAFRYNPENFFNWMRPLARDITSAQPNPAHYGLARLENAGYIKAIITQNIDGLHQRAGSMNVLEVHGTLRTLTCIKCYQQYDATRYSQPYLEHGDIPRCERCKGTLKPDVILYGEQLPARTWMQAQEQIKNCEALIVAGSSLEVLPVAGLPMRAVDQGARLIIINQSETYIDIRADVLIPNNVAEVIPLIASEVLGG
jgi:NAD-dependent deacetylase